MIKNFARNLLVSLFLIPLLPFAQCPSAAFTITPNACAGSPLSITNSSSGAVDFKWDFSPGYFRTTGSVSSDTILPLNSPGDIKAFNQNDSIVVFLAGKTDGNLYRLTYANGPDSALTNFENFGNLSNALSLPSDIELYKENGSWYGIVVDYNFNSVVRFELGSSLLNPINNVVTLLNNSNSNISTAWGIRIRKDETGNVFGIVANAFSGTLTILNFGNSITNTPIALNPINTGQVQATDIELVQFCGHWIAFVAGFDAFTVVTADFGSSFLNTPTFNNLIYFGSPNDIAIVEDSSGYKLLYTNYYLNAITKFSLGSNLLSPNPVWLGTEAYGGLFPKGISIVRKGLKNYAYVLSIGSNQLTAISYGNNSTASEGIVTDAQPSNVSFAEAGTYPVTLTAYDSVGRSSSVTQMVTILESPTASFSFSGTCIGSPTFFQDQSIISTGAISAWSWDFGDGSTSVNQNPLHTYSDTGVYSVKLIVTSSTGCSDLITQSVRIYNNPASSFISSPSACSRSLTTFTDQSTIVNGSVVSWHWDFGNGDSSDVQNPDYIYPAGGIYNLSLTTTSDQGCTNTFNSSITINDRPLASFDAINTCVGQQVQFIDQSVITNSSIVSYLWNLGDGTISNAVNINHVYNGGVADYIVSLIVVTSNGCSDTLNRSIRINNTPVAEFSTSGLVCNYSNIQFNDLSSVSGDSLDGYFWDFGDGSTDTTTNPTHQFETAGDYTVTLIAFAPYSCPSLPVQHVISILSSPTPNFSSSVSCVGSPTILTNSSLAPTGESIDSSFWYLPDGSTLTSYNASFLFSNPGIFSVRLEVISNSGCRADTILPVKVSSFPVPDFSADNTCSAQRVQFTNLSSQDSLSNLTGFNWNFDDPLSGVFNTSTLTNPNHTFNASQAYQVSMTATNSFGCSSTVTKSVLINQSPTAIFTYSPTCFGDQMLFFNPGSAVDSAYLWNFGDFQTNRLREPAHYYAFAGNYTVTLTVFGLNGCTASASRSVTVSPIPEANFTFDNACLNSPVAFTDMSTISSGSISGRKWYINNVIFDSTSTLPSYTFNNLNNFTIKLTVFSDIGCSNTSTQTLIVRPLPEANFSFSPQFGNPPLDVNFSNLSAGGSAYQWDFGDGSLGTSLFEPQHQFTDTGVFTIRQISTNSYGCSDTAEKSIYIIKPILDIAVTGDSSYFDGSYFNIVARLSNLGTREINSVKLIATLDNGSQIKEDFNGTIPLGSGGQLTYNFRSAFPTTNSILLKYYCIKAIEPNQQTDNVSDNNEKCFSRSKIEPGIETFPNPFNEKLTIRLILPYPEELFVALYDANGHELSRLFEGIADAGLIQFHPDITGLSDGIYSLRVLFKNDNFYKQIIKVRSRN